MSVQLQTANYFQQITALVGKHNRAQTTAAQTSVSVEASVEVNGTEEVKERTLADVKQEFYDYLDSLPLSAGLRTTKINVAIADSAFERMLTDPEYEQQMKDLCKRDLCDPNWNRPIPGPPTYIHIRISATPDPEFNSEYLASSYNSGTGPSYEADTQNSFWSRRTKKNDESKKIQEKRQAEKEQLEALLQRAQDRKKMLTDGWQSSFFANLTTQTGFSQSGYGSTGSGSPAGSLFAEA